MKSMYVVMQDRVEVIRQSEGYVCSSRDSDLVTMVIVS